jgi:RNA polymerase sigma-70 factor, ECF subfamily
LETIKVIPQGPAAQVEPQRELSWILGRAKTGDERARNELTSVVSDELRRVASRRMGRERTDHMLSPTAVVYEAVNRLMDQQDFEGSTDQSFLFAAAAGAMRQVLVDHARRRNTDWRSGAGYRLPLDRVVDYFEKQGLDVAAVHESLERLADLNERQSQVVTLRYFGGMTVAEVATALGVSAVTVERDWRLARAWLGTELSEALR